MFSLSFFLPSGMGLPQRTPPCPQLTSRHPFFSFPRLEQGRERQARDDTVRQAVFLLPRGLWLRKVQREGKDEGQGERKMHT